MTGKELLEYLSQCTAEQLEYKLKFDGFRGFEGVVVAKVGNAEQTIYLVNK